MERRTTIINGQPQNIPDTNRVVTWAGLLDYNNMLKNEIPRMGLNNRVAENATFSYAFGNTNELGEKQAVRSGNSYLFGAQNKILQNTFNNLYILGSNNQSIRADGSFDSLYNVYVLGNSNTTINNANHVYILGNSNMAQGNNYTEPLFQAYGFGNNLTLTSDAVWLGQYNDPNDSTAKIVFGIGNGTSNKRKNLLTIDEDGEIRFPNAAFKTLVHFEEGIDLKNSITLGQDTTIMSNFGELRHVLMPYNNNEGFWLVDNKDDPFHINYRQPDDSAGGYTQDQTYQYYVPKEIHFHAGGGQNENNWADIKCGSLDAKGTLTAETIKSIVRHQGNWLLNNPKGDANPNYRYLKQEIEPGLYWIEFFHQNRSSLGDAHQQIGSTVFWCAGDPGESYGQKVALNIEGWDLVITYSIEQGTPYLTIEYDLGGAGGGDGAWLSNVVKFIRIMEGA